MKTALTTLLTIHWLGASIGFGQTPSDLSATAAYAASRQNSDGGFANEPGGPSSLGTTNAAIRILRYTGSSIPDVLGAIDYVQDRFDPATGGFEPAEDQAPTVRSTAIGLMAVAELRIDDQETIDRAVQFLSTHATSFPDVRIAVAGLEAVGVRSEKFDDWSGEILKNRNPDGTWGEGASLAFDTGGTAAALLRMGFELDRRESIIEATRSGQQPDGAWSADGRVTNLSSTYRVVRGMYMLGATPDLDALRGFIARCLRPDGGYAASPDQESSSIASTYVARILLKWANLLEGLPPLVETAGFTPLFNGQNLDGWEGETSLWTVEDGELVGTSTGLDHNEFLATEQSFADFILKFSFRLRDGEGNSGVQFRSERIPGTEMRGYQADIGERYWGSLYDESRRNRVLAEASEQARASVREDRWNQYQLRAIGNRILLRLNNRLSVNYLEEDDEIPQSGRIAVQIHSGGPMEIRFRDLMIQPLPQIAMDGSADSPGFHRKKLKSSAERDRHYVVYLPEGYDGTKKFPVVLFLHGAGERGADGLLQAKVGLGPAIAASPSKFPLIAVFPQAGLESNWQFESPDAQAALSALDEVINEFAVDTNRVILTGLSMGGAGTWSIASAVPDRFSAIVPICGVSENTDTVPVLQSLPCWGFVGDRDRPRFFRSMRAMIRALTEAGADPQYTEYLDVGHNSWDRAYNEPGLVDWMLSKQRYAD